MTATRIWCVAALLVLGVTTVGQAQSLVDVAAREKERRSAVTQPSRVYTNADAKPVPYTPPAPATLAPAQSLREEPAPQRDEPEGPAVVVHRRQTGTGVVRKMHEERTTDHVAQYVQQPIIINNYVNNYVSRRHIVRLRRGLETSGVNTAREQAMANYMRDAGFGGGPAPAGPR